MQFHVNKCILGGANGDLVAIAQHEENLYQMKFREVCGTDATNLVCSHARCGPMELWHLE